MESDRIDPILGNNYQTQDMFDKYRHKLLFKLHLKMVWTYYMFSTRNHLKPPQEQTQTSSSVWICGLKLTYRSKERTARQIRLEQRPSLFFTRR